MSFNGSGTFVINSSGQPVVANTVISSTVFNALTADLATGLSTCITKDGQTTPTANIPMGTFKFTNLGNGSAATDSATLGQVQASTTKLVTVTGSDTIAGTMNPALTAYASGQMFYFIAAGANTGAVTLNIDGLGARNVTRDGSTALAANDILSGEVALVVYDGTRFQLLNPANAGSMTVSNLTVTGTTTLSGLTASTALALDASKAVVSVTNTGTGNNVLATSPTLTTPNLGTPSAIVLTNASGTASININGTVGATTPNTGSFTTLTTSSTVTLNGGTANGVLYLNGSKVATSGSAFAFNGTDLTLPAEGYRASATSFLRLSGGDGVGNGANLLLFGQTHATAPGRVVLTATGTGYLQLATFGGAATLDSSGNLGLGVTPSAVSVGDKVVQVGSFLFNNNTNGYGILRYNNFYNGTNDVYYANGTASAFQMQGNAFKWYQAASGTAGNAITFTQAMTLDSSGNLGIGTASPASRLDVNYSDTAYSVLSAFRNLSTNTGGYSVAQFSQSASGSATGIIGTGGSTAGNTAFQNTFVVGTQSNHSFVFVTNDTARMRITGAGNIVAGASAALATTATDGFLYVPTCAGTPTGTPTAITGMAPIVVDTTNNKMYFYSGGQWRDAGP